MPRRGFQPRMYYGLGTMVCDIPDRGGRLHWLGRSGGGPGISAVVACDIDRRTFVATPANGSPAITRDGHTLNILRREHGRWLLARDANLLGPPRSGSVWAVRVCPRFKPVDFPCRQSSCQYDPLFAKELSMATGTVTLHRVLRAPAERVYNAFLDRDAVARWLPPYGYLCQVHELDAKVGGKHRMTFRNFGTGHGHSFGGTYLELVPNQVICYSDQFDDANMAGQMRTRVTLREVSCGTEISIVQEGIPEMIPTEMCYLGWQESLEQLKRLVEPQLPD